MHVMGFTHFQHQVVVMHKFKVPIYSPQSPHGGIDLEATGDYTEFGPRKTNFEHFSSAVERLFCGILSLIVFLAFVFLYCKEISYLAPDASG
jgi:hypothetical protein